MNHPQLDKAREWAESVGKIEGLIGTRAAAEVVQSLPDQWIDAEKLREVLDRWAENPFPTSDEVAVLNDFEALLTPSLPTLAELIEAGNDPQQYQRMQVELDGFLPGAILIGPGDHIGSSRVAYRGGTNFALDNKKVTPLPDLPKLEWPGGGVEDAPVVDGEPTLPRPEEAKPGDYWLVRIGGRLTPVAAERDHKLDDFPWTVLEGSGGDHYPDAYITLVSRLAPEVKP